MKTQNNRDRGASTDKITLGIELAQRSQVTPG